MDRNSHTLIVSTQKMTNRNHSDDSRISHNILELCEDKRHIAKISELTDPVYSLTHRYILVFVSVNNSTGREPLPIARF